VGSAPFSIDCGRYRKKKLRFTTVWTQKLKHQLGHGAFAATVGEAASLDYVLLAVPWPNVEDALGGLPEWNRRVLIDATNPFIEYSPKLVLADLGGKGASEIVAGLAPGARVVKAFNSIVTARFNEGPAKNGGRRVIFISGDDSEAKRFITGLIKSFGFEPIDLGGLVTGGRLQQAGGPLAGRELVDFGRH
jgi:predicted dinucleotide-binding enzyme